MLEVVSLNPQPTKMADIIRGTGMTKPTAHRVVNMLLEMGFLERDSLDRGFIEGSGLVDLAYRTLAAAAPRSLRHSILQGISDSVAVKSYTWHGSRQNGRWGSGLMPAAGFRLIAQR